MSQTLCWDAGRALTLEWVTVMSFRAAPLRALAPFPKDRVRLGVQGTKLSPLDELVTRISDDIPARIYRHRHRAGAAHIGGTRPQVRHRRLPRLPHEYV